MYPEERWEYVETFLIATSGEGATGIYTMCRVIHTKLDYSALNLSTPRLLLALVANMIMI